MKKINIGIIGIIPLIMLIMACASKPAASGNKTLDQALLEAADRIDEVITKGTKIAMINFSSPSDQFSSYVLDELSANLVDSRNLTVIDRQGSGTHKSL
jgi:cadmium resistance protein CadD (predicted permease)